MYECMNCGGELRFDIPSQKLLCMFCDSRFEPEEYQKEYFAESSDFDINILQCPSCGGEVTATNLSAIEYCPYCGRAVVPSQVKKKQNKPDCIIPFLVTKEDAKQAYKKYVKKNWLAPSAIKKEEFLNGFQGMYLPYWSYNVGFAKNPEFQFKESRNRGNYTYTDTYALTADLDAGFDGITYDASSFFDDVIGQSIVPYDQSKRKEFNPSYMFGFYGEVQDVKPTVYEQEAIEAANRSMFEKFRAEFPSESLDYPERATERNYAFGAEIRDTKNVMMPIWFLTWRNKKNVAYAVVNGQNGKMYADIPVSPAKLLIFAILLAVPIFAVLYFLLPTLSIYTMLLVASAIGVVSIYGSAKVSDQIYEQIERINNKKPFLRNSKIVGNGVSQAINIKNGSKGKKNISKYIGMFFYICMILMCFGSGAIALIAYFAQMQRRSQRSVGYLIVLVALLIILRRILKKKGQRTNLLKQSIGAIAGIVVACAIHLINPAHDLYYYIAGVIVIAGIIWSLVSLVRQYNALATHPDPYFFKERSGK